MSCSRTGDEEGLSNGDTERKTDGDDGVSFCERRRRLCGGVDGDDGVSLDGIEIDVPGDGAMEFFLDNSSTMLGRGRSDKRRLAEFDEFNFRSVSSSVIRFAC